MRTVRHQEKSTAIDLFFYLKGIVSLKKNHDLRRWLKYSRHGDVPAASLWDNHHRVSGRWTVCDHRSSRQGTNVTTYTLLRSNETY